MITERITTLLKEAQHHISVGEGEVCLQTTQEDRKAFTEAQRKIDAALAELQDNGWQPISTAPKDRRILLFGETQNTFGVATGQWKECKKSGDSGYIISTSYIDRHMYCVAFENPTYWRELPPLPSEGEAS